MGPRTVAVVGAGTMGAGIAQKIAQEGFAVLLADTELVRADAGRAKVAASLDEAVAKQVLGRAEAEAALARVRAVGDLAELRDADLVIEAIFEDLFAKKELFRRLDAICRPDCVLATNTSSFYVGELASVTRRPERVVGLHYFFHPAKNRLLELIPGHLHDEAVLASMERFGEAHGKVVCRVQDAPGFAVNRFFVPWLNEAARLVEEGLADAAAVDAVAREAFGVGLGPFALMNATGPAIALHSSRTLGTELGPFYEPAELLAKQVASGRPWDIGAEPAALPERSLDLLRERLLGVVFTVAATLVDEGVASREDVDRGARIGLRWDRGPFEKMNAMGTGEALRLVEALVARHSDLSVPESLAALAVSGEPWSFSRVSIRVDDGIARITLDRPEVLNALDEELVEQLDACFEEAFALPGVRGVVLASRGKAWVAGADISFFVRAVEDGAIPRIVSFTERGQALLRRIEGAPVPVVARVHGMALGGGLELALACHGIVCAERASFGLPETGIGIYPGLGGTQRLPRIVGMEAARRMVLTGRTVAADEALRMGLVLDLVPAADLDAAARSWIERGVPDKYASQGPVAAGTGPAEAAADQRLLARKAPLALRFAERLLDEGQGLPLEEALRLELRDLPAIFATEDALAGLRAVLARQRPSWVGR
jgi:enoyl-CoA hydratase/3-hydroxyacyl-CoA dehydrogenase